MCQNRHIFPKTQSRALRKRRIKPDVELPESPNRASTCAYNDETVHDWNTDRRRLRHHGIVHNQVPHTTAFEQFTKFKFDQLAYANFGGTDRFVAGTIGFLATWLVGSYYTWFLAERCWPVQDSDSAQFPNHSRNSNRFRDRSFCCDHWVCLRTLD